MGVPFYYAYLKRAYRRIAYQQKRKEAAESFQKYPALSLNLDFNGIIHEVAAEVYHYGKNSDKTPKAMAKLQATPRAELQNRHFAGVVAKIYELIELVNPRDTLNIAVDGPAPYAKLYQQKQRRFKSKGITTEEPTNGYFTYTLKALDGSTLFDSNAITPGTTFMEELDAYIREWLKLNRNLLPPRVIYSGHRSPGEGEHKIAQYLRTLKFKGRGDHVIHGLDADLIMLALLSPQKRVVLLREDPDRGEYHTLIISQLRQQLRAQMGSVEDYVLLTFLAGNDFLPAMPSISISSEGIDKLLALYKELDQYLVYRDTNRLNWPAFRQFMELFQREENTLLTARAVRGSKFPSVPLAAAYRNKTLDLARYREVYYQRALGSRGDTVYEDLLTDPLPMAAEWCSGLAWVYKYYAQGIDAINVEWLYHYNYTPLAPEVVKVLSDDGVSEAEWTALDRRGRVLTPYAQLIAVLPPASAGLLPAVLQPLLTSPTSPLADLYPSTFQADINGKDKDHEAIALLPFIEGDRTTTALRALMPTPDALVEDEILIDYSTELTKLRHPRK